MLSIRQCVEQSMWTEAAEALASALSVLPRNTQTKLAYAFIDYARKVLIKAGKGQWPIGTLSAPRLPEVSDQGSPPWIVHIADARDNLEELELGPSVSDAEFSSKAAASFWDVVVGLQVAVWAAFETDDFLAWRVGSQARGPFENGYSKKIAASLWLQIDKKIRKQAEFAGMPDAEIYKMRPAVVSLRDAIEAI